MVLHFPLTFETVIVLVSEVFDVGHILKIESKRSGSIFMISLPDQSQIKAKVFTLIKVITRKTNQLEVCKCIINISVIYIVSTVKEDEEET